MNKNKMSLSFDSLLVNEGLARTVISSFCLQLNPSLEELNDLKTAVSEAVTNCIVHAYGKNGGTIKLDAQIENDKIFVQIADTGVGIKNIKNARMPFFTTKPNEERSGMGFCIMETFMDEVDVIKNSPSGTIVKMSKQVSGQASCKEMGENEDALSRRNY